MIVSCDAAQLEWRTSVQLSGDPTGLKEILNGDDTHELNRIAFSLPSRLISKIYLFRTIFRGSGWSFANDPDFMHVSASPSYWDEVNEKFYKKYNVLDSWHKQLADVVLSGQPIVGVFGRFWPIAMGTDRRGELKIPWTLLTNYPVQGTGADVMAIARVSFARRLKQSKDLQDVKLVSSVHDSVVVDCPAALVQEVVNLFHQVFDDLPKNIERLFGYKWDVPLKCECKAGVNMMDVTEVTRSDY